MIKKIRRHMVIVAAVVTAAVLCIVWGWFAVAVRDNNLHLQTMFGSLSPADDVTISGLLADTRQKSAFTLHIRDGDYTVSQSFSASSEEFLNSFDHSSLPIKKINYLLPAQGAKVEDHSEDAYTKGYTLLVTDYAQLYYAIEGPDSDFLFATDVVYGKEGAKLELEFAPQKDPKALFPTYYMRLWGLRTGEQDAQPYLIRQAGEKTYIFTRTGADCRGFGGLYDITEALESPAGDQPVLPNDSRYYQIELPNLAPIDLEDGNVQIFGMEVVGDRMVFLLLDGGEIVLRWFDPQTLTFVGDTSLGVPMEREGDGDQLPVYQFTTVGKEQAVLEIPSIFDDEVRATNYFLLSGASCAIEASCTDSRGYISWRPSLVLWKNERLYTLKSVPTQYPTGVFDTHLLLNIYDDGRLVYSGAVVSSAADDARYAEQSITAQEPLPIREYYDLSLK